MDENGVDTSEILSVKFDNSDESNDSDSDNDDSYDSGSDNSDSDSDNEEFMQHFI